MLTTFPNFSSYSIQQILRFTKIVHDFEPRADFSPGYISSYYNTDGKLQFCKLFGNLIAKYTDPESKETNITIYGINRLEKSITNLFFYQKEHNMQQRIASLDERQAIILKKGGMIVKRTPEMDEYILSVSTQARLDNIKLKSQARAVRNFIRNYGNDITIYELDLSTHSSAGLIINAWHAWQQYFKNTNNDPDNIERKYISLYLMHADELPTKNFIISHAGQIIGFGFYDVFTDHRCAVFHILKVDYAYNHAFDFGLHVMANRLNAKGIEYINIEEDMGIPGLRYKKTRLLPVKKLRRYSVSPIV